MKTMRRVSLRFLFLLILAVAVICTLGKTAYEAYVYRTTIIPAWKEFPVTSNQITVAELNDIKIYFNPGSLDLASNATLVAAKEFELQYNGQAIADDNRLPGEELKGCYDLDCDLGKFRVIFIGDAYANVTGELDGFESPFHVALESVSLKPDSPTSKIPLWNLRRQLGYSGDKMRLHHFQCDSKLGFISSSADLTTMEIFDESGVHCIRVLPIAPKESDWSALADRLVLINQARKPSDSKAMQPSSP